jgi:hypothetical protein
MGPIEKGERKDYMLTIRIPIRGIDDCDARMKSKEFMAGIDSTINWGNGKVKLQEIYDGKAPRKIEL